MTQDRISSSEPESRGNADEDGGRPLTVDLSKVDSTDSLCGEDEEETELLQDLLKEATRFLEGFPWCGRVITSYYDDSYAIGGVVAVFLFNIEPVQHDVPEWLWIVVGDLPPAYIVTDLAPDARSALERYVWEMERWIAVVRRKESAGNDVIPVDVEPNDENAEALQTRIDFLKERILAAG